MASIGSLTADLRLESAAFIRDIAKATQTISKSSKQMERDMRRVQKATADVSKNFSKLKNAAGALGGALAVRQFARFTTAALDSADAIAKTSKQLGIAATALQQYRIEAQLAGVETTEVDKAMGAFVKRVGELRAGTGALATLLGKTNVELADQLKAAASVEDAFRLMLQAVDDAPTSFDKVALSAAAFSRTAGIAMVNLASTVGQLDAEMVGLVTRSDEMLASAERLKDETTLLREAFTVGFESSIIEGLSGSVDATVESMKEAREIGEKFGKAVGTAMKGVAIAAEFVANNMREIGAAIAALIAYKAAAVFLGIASAVVTFGNALLAARSGMLALSIAAAANPIGLIAVAVGAAVAALTIFHDKTIQIGNTTISVGRSISAAWITIAESVDVATTAIGFVGASLAAFARMDFASAAFIRQEASDRTITSVNAIGDAWSSLEPVMVAAGETSEELAEIIAVLDDGLLATVDTTRSFQKTLEDQRDIARRMAAAWEEGAEAVELVEAAVVLFNQELAQGTAFTEDQRLALFALIKETNSYNRAIEETVKAQQDAEQATEDALTAAQDAMADNIEAMKQQREENTRVMQQPFLNAIDGIQSSFSDMFENILSGGVTSFSDMAQAVKRIMIRMASEIATLMVFRPVVGSTLSSIGFGDIGNQLTGSPSGGGGGGLGSLTGGGIPSPPTSSLLGNFDIGGSINSFGASLGFASSAPSAFTAAGSGGGAFAAGVAGPPALGGGAFGATTFSSFLGGAGAGFGTGMFVNSLLGGNETGGTVGSGVGSIAGSLIGSIIPGVGTVIGGMIGGALGGALGGLFGPGESVGPNAAARLGGGPLSDGFFVGGVGADNGGDLAGVTREAQKAADALNDIQKALDLTVERNTQQVLGANDNFIGVGKGVGGFRSAESLVNAFLARGGFTSDNENLDKVIQGSTAKTLEENISLLGSIPGLLGPAISAFDAAAEAVNDNFDSIAKKAAKFGLDITKVEAARVTAMERLRLQAQAPFIADAANVVGFLNAQSLSGGSSLSPTERLAEAQRQYDDLLGRVQGGEAGLGGALTSAASNFLAFGRNQFASTGDFAGIESSVRGDLLDVAENITSEDFFQAQIEATQQQTDVIADGQESSNLLLDKLIQEIRTLRREMSDAA